MSALAGPDGRLRCPWAVSSEDYRDYHDTEWGRTVHGEPALFERLCLEGFQSGLSWITILRKRDAFRRAFEGFDPHRVAAFGEAEVAQLMGNAGIVRNEAKIRATIGNARALLALPDGESLGLLLDRHRPPEKPAPQSPAEVPAETPESRSLSKELRRHGFRFVGPVTAYAMLQATGYVNDHLAGCEFRTAS
ncbi:DNA-3-methyladenine glycosylase I [Arthrobacter gandavensis]|uniref:DNA-3-methyladenine glycosylase I n=1 Tax=Arthrobacter gandavensis TaxID=169960 RepID=UPI00188F8571|nr:DNA-3-methyladenine glycosylase I [Arthrobacter gandavensis]MBF4993754.1 DNA-3-methyladenine glycosylase I [Arthrobacter gandavensis]